jgi:Rad3-related DNA helicase
VAEPAETATPLCDLVEADLRAGGALSQTLPGYTERPAQIAMARSVADAIEHGGHLAIEAATGTGKSLAYLLPVIRSGKVAIISTANKNLQEQLFYKDIPFIQQYVQPFEAALVKGMGNYLCLDRFSEEQPFQKLVAHPAYISMEQLIGRDHLWDGDLDLLEISLPTSLRAVLAADGDQCAWHLCPHFGPCYVRRMRDHAHEAEIIVVNHTLLLLDAVMKGFLLPERDLVVIDEAHHLEEEATRAFTVTVTPGRVASLLSQRRLREHADLDVQQETAAANANTWDALERALRQDLWIGRQPLHEPLQEGLRLAGAIGDLATSLQRNRPLVMEDKDEQLYEKLVKRARTLGKDLKIVFGVSEPEERVYYVERAGGRGRARTAQQNLSVSATPLSVADLLRELLFDKVHTVCTSATLAVGGSFAYFRGRVGLVEAHDEVLPLTFDYRSHALLYVPRLRRDPAFGAAGGPYLDELADQMRALVEVSRGRAFLLFSSQRALDGVLARVEEALRDQGFMLLVQGQEMGRIELLRRFRAQPASVLFGLKSFWEGVDVVGEALSLVVIDKLPFDPPDDPVHEARVNRMKANGENWFGGYVLPQATLRLKQGLGRLLRTADDRGVMAILDNRLHTKSYGRQVLAALPPARRTADFDDVRRFFDIN